MTKEEQLAIEARELDSIPRLAKAIIETRRRLDRCESLLSALTTPTEPPPSTGVVQSGRMGALAPSEPVEPKMTKDEPRIPIDRCPTCQGKILVSNSGKRACNNPQCKYANGFPEPNFSGYIMPDPAEPPLTTEAIFETVSRNLANSDFTVSRQGDVITIDGSKPQGWTDWEPVTDWKKLQVGDQVKTKPPHAAEGVVAQVCTYWAELTTGGKLDCIDQHLWLFRRPAPVSQECTECMKCGGTGKHRILGGDPYARPKCPACDGTGREKLTAPVSQGEPMFRAEGDWVFLSDGSGFVLGAGWSASTVADMLNAAVEARGKE